MLVILNVPAILRDVVFEVVIVLFFVTESLNVVLALTKVEANYTAVGVIGGIVACNGLKRKRACYNFFALLFLDFQNYKFLFQ